MIKKVLLLIALWAAFVVCGEAHGMEVDSSDALKVKNVRQTFYEPAHECFERFLVQYDEAHKKSRSTKEFYEKILPVVKVKLETFERLDKEFEPLGASDISSVSGYLDTVGLYIMYGKSFMESQLEFAGKLSAFPDALDELRIEGYNLSNIKDLVYKEKHFYSLFTIGKGTYELTKEKCFKIKPGMKYDDVVKLLKMPPSGVDYIVEKENDVYYWVLDKDGKPLDYVETDSLRPDFKYLRVVFSTNDNLDDIVVKKEIFNL